MFKIENIIITPKILKLIAEIDEFKGKWEAIENLAPERLEVLKRVATIESVGSSTRIEGAKLSDVEVEELISGLTSKSFQTRDEQEVAGYAKAMNLIYDNYESINITENHIKQLHQVLLEYSEKDKNHRGEYKTIDNHVEAFDRDGKSIGVIFETTSPFETPEVMKSLVRWYNESEAEEEYHPLILIGIFIVYFLAIHPFKDGNGRLSRVLTTLLLLRMGYEYVPFSSMESIIEMNKDNYYISLRQSQTMISKNQNWEPWLTYFFETLVKQKNNLSLKVTEERSLKQKLPLLSRQILELAKTRGEVSVKEIEVNTGANRNTIKYHIKSLTDSRYLQSLGKGRGATYRLL